MHKWLATFAAASAMVLGSVGTAVAQEAHTDDYAIEIIGPAVPATDNWSYLNDAHGGLAAVEIPVSVRCPEGEDLWSPWAGLTDYFADGHLAEPFMMAHAAPTLIACTGAPQRELIRAATIHNRQFAYCNEETGCRPAEFFTEGPATFQVQLGRVGAPLATDTKTIQIVVDEVLPPTDDVTPTDDPPPVDGPPPVHGLPPGDDPPLGPPQDHIPTDSDPGAGTEDRASAAVPPSVPIPDIVTRFSDIELNVHQFAIVTLTANGIIDGYPDGSFRPSEFVTRGQMATLVHRAMGLPGTACTPACSFTDVAGSSAHAVAIETLAATGLVQGFPDGRFRPDDFVTRGQMATILQPVLGLSSSGVGFPDMGRTHADAIRALQAATITHGFSDGTFRPSALLRRV